MSWTILLLLLRNSKKKKKWISNVTNVIDWYW